MKKRLKILIVAGPYKETEPSRLKISNEGHSVVIIESFEEFLYTYAAKNALSEFDCVLVALNLKSMSIEEFSRKDVLSYGSRALEMESTGLEVVLKACEARVPLICLSNNSNYGGDPQTKAHSNALELWSQGKPFFIGDSKVFINNYDEKDGVRWYNLLLTIL